MEGPKTPGPFAGVAEVYYDGLDSEDGLDIDFTRRNTTGLAFLAFTEKPTELVISAVDMDGRQSNYTIQVAESVVPGAYNTYNALYQNFKGDCNFAAVSYLGIETPITAFSVLKLKSIVWQSPNPADNGCQVGTKDCP